MLRKHVGLHVRCHYCPTKARMWWQILINLLSIKLHENRSSYGESNGCIFQSMSCNMSKSKGTELYYYFFVSFLGLWEDHLCFFLSAASSLFLQFLVTVNYENPVPLRNVDEWGRSFIYKLQLVFFLIISKFQLVQYRFSKRFMIKIQNILWKTCIVLMWVGSCNSKL